MYGKYLSNQLMLHFQAYILILLVFTGTLRHLSQHHYKYTNRLNKSLYNNYLTGDYNTKLPHCSDDGQRIFWLITITENLCWNLYFSPITKLYKIECTQYRTVTSIEFHRCWNMLRYDAIFVYIPWQRPLLVVSFGINAWNAVTLKYC